MTPSAIWSFDTKTAVISGSCGEGASVHVSAAGRPVADRELARRQPVLAEDGRPAAHPFGRVHGVGRPADVPDLAVPELDEVLDGEAGTGVLVEPDPVHAAAVFGGDGDDRHAELDAVERVERLALRRDEHDGLDVLPHEQFGRGAHARGVLSSMLAVIPSSGHRAPPR